MKYNYTFQSKRSEIGTFYILINLPDFWRLLAGFFYLDSFIEKLWILLSATAFNME